MDTGDSFIVTPAVPALGQEEPLRGEREVKKWERARVGEAYTETRIQGRRYGWGMRVWKCRGKGTANFLPGRPGLGRAGREHRVAGYRAEATGQWTRETCSLLSSERQGEGRYAWRGRIGIRRAEKRRRMGGSVGWGQETWRQGARNIKHSGRRQRGERGGDRCEAQADKERRATVARCERRRDWLVVERTGERSGARSGQALGGDGARGEREMGAAR